MLEKLFHHKLMTEGHEGEGVITQQKVEGVMSENGFIKSFYIGVKGHIKFDDGSEGQFSSVGLSTSKVGDLQEGAIVPVRYDDAHKNVVLDVSKLEATRKNEKQAAIEWTEHHNAEQIAAADEALAKASQGAPHSQGASSLENL